MFSADHHQYAGYREPKNILCRWFTVIMHEISNEQSPPSTIDRVRSGNAIPTNTHHQIISEFWARAHALISERCTHKRSAVRIVVTKTIYIDGANAVLSSDQVHRAYIAWHQIPDE